MSASDFSDTYINQGDYSMTCNRKGNYVEVVCFDGDSGILEQFGFTCEFHFRGNHLVKMTHPNAACSAVPAIVSLGERGFCFYGYAGNWLANTPGLMAGDGERSIVMRHSLPQ